MDFQASFPCACRDSVDHEFSALARRTYFVRNDGVAGTRPVCAYAGQYADPTGMWSVGVGLVFGWDKSHGWNVGVESAPFSYSWNQDGSGSFNVGVHGNYQFYILNLGRSEEHTSELQSPDH